MFGVIIQFRTLIIIWPPAQTKLLLLIKNIYRPRLLKALSFNPAGEKEREREREREREEKSGLVYIQQKHKLKKKLNGIEKKQREN